MFSRLSDSAGAIQELLTISLSRRSPDIPYEARITTAAEYKADNTLTSNKTWSFTVKR